MFCEQTSVYGKRYHRVNGNVSKDDWRLKRSGTSETARRGRSEDPSDINAKSFTEWCDATSVFSELWRSVSLFWFKTFYKQLYYHLP